MSDNTQKIVSYTADATQLLNTIRTIEQANAQMATALQGDFVRATQVMSSSVSKVKDVKIFDENGMQTDVKLMSELNTVVKLADGNFAQITKTMTTFSDGTGTVGISVKSLGNSLGKTVDSADTLKGQFSQLGTNLNNVTDINRKFGNELANVGKVSRVVKQNMSEFSGDTKKMGNIVEGVNGKFYQLKEVSKRGADGIQKITRSVKEVSKEMATGSTATASMAQNIARLATRAILTIPLWLALRGAMMGTISVIKEGVKAIIEQDKAFQKARRNIEATASSQEQLNIQFKKLKEETLKLSLASGKSVKELTDAFQRFATVGFDAETSLVGMQYATKLAVAEFGDAKETADAFARSMRVLIDTTAGAKPEAQQLAEAMALTDELWKTNAFEIKEFTNNLSKFGGTAKIANLSAEETIKLLATLSTGGMASRAGQLLKTTIIKALSNLDEVSKKLNLNLDPAVDSTYDTLFKLINGLKQVGAEQKAPVELADTLRELFSIKGTEVLATFTALEKTLKQNAKVVPDVAKLDKSFQDITETTGILVDRFHQANSAIGRTLMEGILGGEDFNTTLKTIVKSLNEFVVVADKMGFAVNSIAKGIKGLEIISAGLANAGIFGGQFKFPDFTKLITLSYEVEKLEKELKDASLASLSFGDSIKEALNGKLDASGLERVIGGIKARLNSTELLEGFDIIPLKKSLAILEDMLVIKKEDAKLAEKQIELEKNIAFLASGYLDSSFAQVDAKKKLVEYTKELLKLQGFSESQILKTEQRLINQYGIEEDIGNKLDRQLKIQQAINKEKRLTNDVSSDATKLFEIAKTDGTAIAKKISEVLSGDVDFDIFTRQGGKALEVFKDKFGDIFDAQQIKAFFKGDIVSGEPGLRGGQDITLAEEDSYLQKTKTEVERIAKTELSLAQDRLVIEEKINALRTQQLLNQNTVKTEVTSTTPAKETTKDTTSSNVIQKSTPFFEGIKNAVNIGLKAGMRDYQPATYNGKAGEPIDTIAMANKQVDVIGILEKARMEMLKSSYIPQAPRSPFSDMPINKAKATIGEKPNINITGPTISIAGNNEEITKQIQEAMDKTTKETIKKVNENYFGKQNNG